MLELVLNKGMRASDDEQGINKMRPYSAINYAKSPLSHIILIPTYKKFSEHPLMLQYEKAVFNLRPARPKLQFVLDVKFFFSYLEKEV